MATHKVIYKAKPPVPPPKPKTSSDTTTITYVAKTKTKPGEERPQRQRPVKVTLPWYYNLLIIILWVLLVFCVIEFIMARLRYIPYTKWWKNNGGDKYKKVFNINLFAQFDSFYLGYWFLSLFQSGDAAIPTKGVARFINDLIITYAKINDEDPLFLLPVNICETIIVGDRKGKPNPPDTKNRWDPDTNWPADLYTWRSLLKSWGMNDDKETAPDFDKWKAASDNFFWRKYTIIPTAPVLQGFMLGTFEYDGVIWNPNALAIALGFDPLSGGSVGIRGGWWGYVLYGFQTEKDLSYETIIDSIRSSVPLAIKPPCDTTKKALNWVGCVLQGLTAGIGLAAFGVPGGFVLGAGLLGLGGSITNNFATGKCMT